MMTMFNTLALNPVLFIGSSSIVFWETAKSFPDLPLINRGFGGECLQRTGKYGSTRFSSNSEICKILASMKRATYSF
jgi:hypothetical protein